MNDERFEETISSSKEESMLKAVSVLYEDLAANERKIKRPDIDVKKSLVKVLVILFIWILSIVGTAIAFLQMKSPIILVSCLAALAILVALTLKKATVLSVLLYQRLAPEKLRRSCLFTPSCSEYMLLAIEKYGICKGLFLGVRRLFRCHGSNGGVDYP